MVFEGSVPLVSFFPGIFLGVKRKPVTQRFRGVQYELVSQITKKDAKHVLLDDLDIKMPRIPLKKNP